MAVVYNNIGSSIYRLVTTVTIVSRGNTTDTYGVDNIFGAYYTPPYRAYSGRPIEEGPINKQGLF